MCGNVLGAYKYHIDLNGVSIRINANRIQPESANRAKINLSQVSQFLGSNRKMAAADLSSFLRDNS